MAAAVVSRLEQCKVTKVDNAFFNQNLEVNDSERNFFLVTKLIGLAYNWYHRLQFNGNCLVYFG